MCSLILKDFDMPKLYNEKEKFNLLIPPKKNVLMKFESFSEKT